MKILIIIITIITWMTEFIIIKEVKVDALPRVVGVGGNPARVPINLCDHHDHHEDYDEGDQDEDDHDHDQNNAGMYILFVFRGWNRPYGNNDLLLWEHLCMNKMQ